MTLEQLVQVGFQQGGLAILALILLYLHITGSKSFTATVDKLMATFQAEQKYEREQCQKQFEQVLYEIRESRK